MKRHYELWDQDSANLIGVYDTEQDALRVVAAYVHAGDVICFALGEESDEGLPEHFRLVGDGEELNALAVKAFPTPESV